MKLALIMLAAGNSSRFGSNKLLFPVEGKPLYLRILEKLMELSSQLETEGISCTVTVVTQYPKIGEAAAARQAEVIYNPHPREGISYSLKLGLHTNIEADACFFTVSDQPWLTVDTMLALIRGFLCSEKGIACLESGGEPGNPCIFSKAYYPMLLALSGDMGGKRVMKAHMEDVLLIPVKDARQLEDLDTCPKRMELPR